MGGAGLLHSISGRGSVHTCKAMSSTMSGSLSRFGRSCERITTSKLFISSRKAPETKLATTKGHKYLLANGFIRQCFSGGYYLLPLGQRCLDKLIKIIDSEMQRVGGVKMTMPILSPSSLWKQSGRWDSIGKELFRLSDQKKNVFCLGPTHEEMITDFVSKELESYKQLPLRLYQLDRKFRDELRPRHGLLRAKEFWMKDMYTFDVCPSDAALTYEAVCQAYERIFDRLNIITRKVLADSGNIGGSLSHEYHVTAPGGEDRLMYCERCGLGCNSEVLGDDTCDSLPNCPNDGVNCEVHETKGIEVAHAFNLGTKYSEVFKAYFNEPTNKRAYCQMGCYGMGVTRLLQAIVEHRLTNSDNRMVWPLPVAPFTTCVIPLYHKKDPSGQLLSKAHRLYDVIDSLTPGDVILDDREHVTMGEKLRHAEVVGYPVTVVAGKEVSNNEVELLFQSTENKVVEITKEDNLIERLKSIL